MSFYRQRTTDYWPAWHVTVNEGQGLSAQVYIKCGGLEMFAGDDGNHKT